MIIRILFSIIAELYSGTRHAEKIRVNNERCTSPPAYKAKGPAFSWALPLFTSSLFHFFTRLLPHRWWRRRILRRRQITRNLVLRADRVHHNLVQPWVLAAVKLQRLIHVAVLLLIPLVVGVHHQRELVLLGVRLLEFKADRPHRLLV